MSSIFYRDKWKLEGKCTNCGTTDKHPNLSKCLKCANVMVYASRRWKEKNPNDFRDKYHQRKEAGVCVSCGVEGKPFKNKSLYCVDCAKTEAARGLRLKFEIIQKYGGVCVCCKESNYAFLSLDHINNDGNVERHKYGTGGGWYKKLRKIPIDPSLQVMCYNCNFSKKVTGSCAHTDHEHFSNALIAPKIGRKKRDTDENKHLKVKPTQYYSSRHPAGISMYGDI